MNRPLLFNVGWNAPPYNDMKMNNILPLKDADHTQVEIRSDGYPYCKVHDSAMLRFTKEEPAIYRCVVPDGQTWDHKGTTDNTCIIGCQIENIERDVK